MKNNMSLVLNFVFLILNSFLIFKVKRIKHYNLVLIRYFFKCKNDMLKCKDSLYSLFTLNIIFD